MKISARGALSGLVAAFVALGVAELVAGLAKSLRSPVIDVGDRVVDNVPAGVKSLAIQWFGTSDKVALLVGIVVVLAVFAAALGMVAASGRLVSGMAGMALFGVLGSGAARTSRGDRSLLSILPSVLGAAAGMLALRVLVQRGIGIPSTSGRSGPAAIADGAGASRRAFLTTSISLAGAGAVADATGRWLGSRFSAAASRASVVLPQARKSLRPVPGDASLGVPGVSPFITPNKDFYRIDTALIVSQLQVDTWRLKVTGMVDHPFELSFQDLLDRGLVEADITMTCVSNVVGGDLVGNARWSGVRLEDLLGEAGVRDDADQIVGRSVDGYTCGFPVDVLDGRPALVAVGMNGEPLPLTHGFPARLIVPGLYGYVSATKWLQEIELTRFDRFDQYWVPRGWDAQAPIKTSSRIDTPKGLARISAGRTAVAGVAWAQTRGIGKVQLRIDDGEWQDARLAEELNSLTWRQWMVSWDATPGRHLLTVRALDGSGAIQNPKRSEPMPNGSSGHHQIVVLVDG